MLKSRSTFNGASPFFVLSWFVKSNTCCSNALNCDCASVTGCAGAGLGAGAGAGAGFGAGAGVGAGAGFGSWLVPVLEPALELVFVQLVGFGLLVLPSGFAACAL